MKLDKILQLFVVKEKKFFPLYIESAENILKAAELLVQVTATEDADERRILSHRIKECETAGDRITDRIIDELIDSFVTPFDRDDVHMLAEDMDTFLDNIRDSAKKFAIYQPKKSKKLAEIAMYIRRDAEILLEMTRNFDNMRDDVKKFDELCDEIKENEHICDDIYESYMSNLFEFEKDAVELVRKKNILQALEDTSDVAKRLSGSIRSIVVKMS
ncbi:MAG: DUF47 family protein [Bacteroidales bacterium]|nr:DUF47 family protein [Candidatus Cryptobacteroides aphodequi]